MKAFLFGMAGTLLMLAAFYLGTLRQNPDAGRYEIQVSHDGTIARLDRKTGQIHVVGSAGERAFAADVPEKLSTVPPR